MTILVADDNAAVRELLRVLLSPLAVVHECADGAAAIARYAQLRPDIVVIDVDMPVLDGLTAARRIMQLDAQACVIVITGLAEGTQLDAVAAAVGARAFIRKEELWTLPAAVAALLAGRRSPD